MTKREILDYILFRASGIGQAPNYTHKDFYNEMVELQRKEIKIQELEDKLKSHDWTYEYSDDNRSYLNGQVQLIAINKLIKQLPEEEAKELYNKYAPDMFKKK